jgi:hypothetical protein
MIEKEKGKRIAQNFKDSTKLAQFTKRLQSLMICQHGCSALN